MFTLPNIITSFRVLLGILAIVSTTNGRLNLAIYIIMITCVLDSLDGWLARRLNQVTALGAHLDSIADWICFGVAPGVIVMWTCLSAYPRIAPIVALIYVSAAAMRLVRFHKYLDEGDAHASNSYVGLPTTASGLLLALFALIIPRLAFFEPSMLILLLILSFLMTSKINFPKINFPKFNKDSIL